LERKFLVGPNFGDIKNIPTISGSLRKIFKKKIKKKEMKKK